MILSALGSSCVSSMLPVMLRKAIHPVHIKFLSCLSAGILDLALISKHHLNSGSSALHVIKRKFTTSTVLNSNEKSEKDPKMNNEEWLKRLTPEQYSVCRLSSTEPPFSGEFYDHWVSGTYTCVCCNAELFRSESKFDSGCGWPAFSASIGTNVTHQADLSHGMVRTEVLCTSCKSHLGHLFDDGPPPTGKRYCINSICLKFTPK